MKTLLLTSTAVGAFALGYGVNDYGHDAVDNIGSLIHTNANWRPSVLKFESLQKTVEPYIKLVVDATNTDVCANDITTKTLRQVLAKSDNVRAQLAGQLMNLQGESVIARLMMMPRDEFVESLHASNVTNNGEVGPHTWSCGATVRYLHAEPGDDKVDRPRANGIPLGPKVAVHGAARPLQVSYTAQIDGDEIWVRVFRANWGSQ